MAITIRSPDSNLGKYLSKYVTEFIKANNEILMNNPAQVNPDIGAQTLGNAIGYAIAKALISPEFLAALNVGIGLSAGPQIVTALNSTIIEPK